MKQISPKISAFLVKFFTGLFFAGIGMVVSSRVYFGVHPLFGYAYLAEFIIGLLLTTFAVLFLPTLIVRFWTNLISTASNFIFSIVYKAMNDIRNQRAERIKETAHHEGTPVLLDTSSVIDGRIYGIISQGFLDNPIIVPQFVIDELQLIADSENNLKRERGRRGLDLLSKIRRASKGRFRIYPLVEPSKDVDHSLVSLAKELKAKIATVDFNLNKAASVSGIRILNVNELANQIKTFALPGDVIQLKIVQLGKESDQGVGYLPDGTMIVVEKGGHFMGKTIAVEISRILQTSAGQMFFAVLPTGR
jgi:uncharacterized protein YacL